MTYRWEYMARECAYRCVDEHEHVLAWLSLEFVIQMREFVDRGMQLPPELMAPTRMLPRYEPEDC